MKNIYIVLLVFISGILLFAVSCKHEPEDMPDPGGGGGGGGGNGCDTLNVTYPATVVPIFDQYCLSCHSGPTPSGGIDLEDYSIVAQLAQNGALLGAIRHETGYSPMPQGMLKLSDCEIAKIEIWIRDTTFVNPPPPECDTVDVTYPGTIMPLLEQYCLSCHSGPTPEGGLNFTNYEDVAFVAESGQLLGAIRHEPGYSPMPANGIQLSHCDITKFEIWVRDTTFTEPGIPCDPDTVYFQNTILPLLQSSCGVIGCHDPGTASDGVILTNYQDIISTAEVVPGDPSESELYEVLVENDPDKRMPPPPRNPLTAGQITSVYKWIAQGAKNNYCDDINCDTLNVTFSETVFPIIQNRCLGCHSGGSPSGGINLENHANIAAVASSGALMGAIRHEPGYSPMPQNGAKLSDCNIAQIQKWIDDGTPNN
ncbi:MAG: c-type cytochrome domain-containing protein [Bacteroidales bacterium]